MSINSAAALAVACVPGAIPIGDRAAHFLLAKRLFGEMARSRNAIADGYEFALPSDAFLPCAQFVKNERLCCPFMRFEIVVQPDADVFVLRITGPQGTREVLEAEFELTACGSSGCGCHAA